MTWQDFLYQKGITEANLTPTQVEFWKEEWKCAYPPPPEKQLKPAPAPIEPAEQKPPESE